NDRYRYSSLNRNVLNRNISSYRGSLRRDAADFHRQRFAGGPSGIRRPAMGTQDLRRPLGRPSEFRRPTIGPQDLRRPMGRPADIRRPGINPQGAPQPTARPSNIRRPVMGTQNLRPPGANTRPTVGTGSFQGRPGFRPNPAFGGYNRGGAQMNRGGFGGARMNRGGFSSGGVRMGAG